MKSSPFLRSFRELVSVTGTNGRAKPVENHVIEMRDAVARALAFTYTKSRRFHVERQGDDEVVITEHGKTAMAYRVSADSAVCITPRPMGSAAAVINHIVATAVRETLAKRKKVK